MPDEKTPEELELEARKARGDFVEEEEEVVDEEEVSEPEEEESPVVAEEEEDEPGDEEPEEKPITIPKARFDDAQRKARERQQELERRIKELESKSETEIQTTDLGKLQEQLDDLSDQYEQALLDGEIDKARQMRRQRDQKQNELYDMKLAQQGEKTSEVTIDQMRYDAQLAQFEARFPSINPDSDDFSEDVAKEVSEMIGVFRKSGLTLSASLNKAVHYVLRDTDEAVHDDPELVKSKRGQQARKRVAKVAKSSPPDTVSKKDQAGQADDDGLPDVTRMTPEQFEKLSDEQIRKLRGDTLSEEVA